MMCMLVLGFYVVGCMMCGLLCWGVGYSLGLLLVDVMFFG